MKVAAYYRANDSRTNERVHAVSQAFGAEESAREHPIPCDLAIQAGFQITPAMAYAMERRIPILILENPCWDYGDKKSVYTVAYNGLNNLGWIPSCKSLPTRAAPELVPWKNPYEGQVTIFGQVDNDNALRGADIYEWIQWVQQIVPHAVLREHPVMLDREEKLMQESFRECLEKTSLGITFSSTCGAQCVIAGIPTVAVHKGSLAYDVSIHTLTEAPIRPDRTEWLHKLSWRHWRTDERLDTEWLLSGYDEAKAQAEKGHYDNMSNGRPQ